MFGGGLWSIPFLVGRFRKIYLHRLHKKRNIFSNDDSHKVEELDGTGGHIVNNVSDETNSKTKSQSDAIIVAAGKSNPRATGMSNISLF